MPFTLSHAAAVLPFGRRLARWHVLSATVIGSMVPDFSLFLPERLPRFETHSALALLTFSLPVGLATYWIFQSLIKTPVLEVLPDAAYQRSRPFAAAARWGSLRQWLLAAAGILAGAVTHLVWDGFTHEGARGVRMIPALDDTVVDVRGHALLGYRVMQDGSSLVGFLIVLVLLGRALYGTRPPVPPARRLQAPERAAWLVAYALTAVAVGAAALVELGFPVLHLVHILHSLGDIAIAALRGLALSLLVVSICLTWRLRFSR
jgi:hypothetical protein